MTNASQVHFTNLNASMNGPSGNQARRGYRPLTTASNTNQLNGTLEQHRVTFAQRPGPGRITSAKSNN